MSTTKWICIGIAVGVIAIDVVLDYLCTKYGKEKFPTITKYLRMLMEKHPCGWLVPFIMGVIVGHICW